MTDFVLGSRKSVALVALTKALERVESDIMSSESEVSQPCSEKSVSTFAKYTESEKIAPSTDLISVIIGGFSTILGSSSRLITS